MSQDPLPQTPAPEESGSLPARPTRPGPSAAARLVPWWVRLGAFAFVAGFIMDAYAGVNPSDESWFLYVLHRVNAGKVLYREVWYHALPLAVWFGAGVTRLLGEQVLVLKGLSALCFAVTIVCCAEIGSRLRARPHHRVLLVLGMLAFAAPGVVGPGSLYTAMAFALLAGVALATVAWLDSGAAGDRRDLRLLLLAGVLGGLTMATKQDVGVYAMIALTAVVLGAERGQRDRPFRDLALCYLLAGAMVCIAVVPVVLGRGVSAFVYDNVTSKTTYIEQSGFTYLDGIELLGKAIFKPRSPWSAGDALRWSVFLLPFIALPLALWAWRRSGDAQHGAVIAFTLAAFAGTFPRSDYPHVVAALPFLVMALIVGWREVRPSLAPWAYRALSIAVIALVIVRFGFAVGEITKRYDSGLVYARIPHFLYAPFPAKDEDAALRSADAMRRYSRGEPVYVVGLRSGLMYLASGMEDPTRYDYPAAGVLGLGGQREVVDGLKSGRISGVWWDSSTKLIPGFTPLVIQAYTFKELHRWPAAPYGSLYTTRKGSR